MKYRDVPETLINETIRVVASVGLERTTTKAITQKAAINEAYIYRYFADKDDLLVKTFEKLDNELMSQTSAHLPVMFSGDEDCEARCWMYFQGVWRFLLGNKDKCLAFIRYYYSPYFSKYSLEGHKERYQPIVEKLKGIFREEANVWMLLNHILNVMLDFAVKVFDNQVPDDEDTATHVFRLVYYSVRPYFKSEEER